MGRSGHLTADDQKTCTRFPDKKALTHPPLRARPHPLSISDGEGARG